MHTPAWLLNIVISYLSNRTTYNGEQSTVRDLPGGGPKGAFLGGLIFIIKYNGAFLRPPIPPLISGPVRKEKAEKVKFGDDGTVAVSVNLKKCLVNDLEDKDNFHERTHQILPASNNLLQYYLDDTEKFTNDNRMKINAKKTKVILFNKARKRDFPPEVSFSDNVNLEVVSELKLVGVIVSSDLRWEKNTLYICQKAMERMWILRRMKFFNLDLEQICDTYVKEIRSILELAAPVWHSGLTVKQSRDIERVQKIALFIMLGDNFINYDVACTIVGIEPLQFMRDQLCLKFANENLKQENSLLTKVTKTVNTRSKPDLVIEPKCTIKRFRNSSIPYLSRIVNKNLQKR